MVAIATIACLLGFFLGLKRRADRFHELAEYHNQASGFLIEKAGGPVCSTGLEEGDIDQIFAGRGREAYLAMKAGLFHGDLAEKYERASRQPWLPIGPDPPPPLESYPKFDFNADLLLQPEEGGFK